MKNKQAKRVLALALTLVLALGTVVTAAAADPTSGGTTGTGTNEGHAEKEVISVTLPTDNTNDFNYIMDPELLIKNTNAYKWNELFPGKGITDASFTTNTGVYFANPSYKWSDKSNKLTVINKSSVAVEITAKASVSSATGITMVAKDAVDKGTNKNLYLGLTLGSTTKNITTTASDSEIKVTLEGKADNYETTYSATGYKFQIKAGVDESTWKTTTINLEGAVNQNATWAGTEVPPTVSVTWSYAKKTDAAPSVENAAGIALTANTAATLKYDLGLGDLAATDVVGVYSHDGTPQDAYIQINKTAHTITVTAGSVDWLRSLPENQRLLRVMFNDDAANAFGSTGTVVEVKFTV